MNIPSSFCDLLIGMATNNKTTIQESLFKFTSDILPKVYKDMFLSMNYIIRGDLNKNIDIFSKWLGIQHSFLLKMIIAIIKKDDQFIRQSINNLDKNLMSLSPDVRGDVDPENMTNLKNHLRVFHRLLNGADIDIVKIVKRSVPDFNPSFVITLRQASIKKYGLLLKNYRRYWSKYA